MANSPMTADDLITLENKADGEQPFELIELQRSNSLYLSTLKKQAEPKLELTKIAERNLWQLMLGEDVVMGEFGETEDLINRDEGIEFDQKIFEAKLPDWSGITYHPKIAGLPTAKSFRRNKGKKVTPHYVFGADDRQIYYPNSYPWRCVGKVLVWNNPMSIFPTSVGTGALVGRNVVLTASHIVPWGTQWRMQFIPAYYDGASLLGSNVSSFVISARGYKDHGQGDDMAVLRLSVPLGDSLGFFGCQLYRDAWEDGNYWTKCGYPSAVASGSRPSRVTWFPIIDDDNDGNGVELEYRADATPGDSGGPVFGWWNDGFPYVIGTHSGSEEEYEFPFSIIKNNVAAGGLALSNLIGWARANW
jgi:V8-like Glu-specific endopeptidase